MEIIQNHLDTYSHHASYLFSIAFDSMESLISHKKELDEVLGENPSYKCSAIVQTGEKVYILHYTVIKFVFNNN